MPASRGFDPVRRRLLKVGALLTLGALTPVVARMLLREEDAFPVAVDPPVATTTIATTTATTTTAMAPASTTTTPEPLVIEVVGREGWGGRAPGPLDPHVPVRLTYHHSASPGLDPDGAPARMRGYQRYHLDQGWPDIAYHFVVDQAGRIYEGRPPDARGDTFTEYDPTGHFLVCLDGDFDLHRPSAASIESLSSILGWAAQTYRIEPSTLGGHRDYATTSCPGENLYHLRDEVEARVRAVLGAGRRIGLRAVPSLTTRSPSGVHEDRSRVDPAGFGPHPG